MNDTEYGPSLARSAQDEIDALDAAVAARDLPLARERALAVLEVAYSRDFHHEGVGTLVRKARAAVPAWIDAMDCRWREWEREQFLAEEAERHRGYDDSFPGFVGY